MPQVGLDLDVVVAGEQGLQPCLLPGGEQVQAGVQHPSCPVQRIGCATAMTVQVLLDPASALVERIAGQPDDVEGIMPTSA